MIHEKKDNINIIASALVLVIFFVFFGNFTQKKDQPIGKYYQYEIAINNHYHTPTLADIQKFVFQENDISCSEIVHLLASNSHLSASLANQLIGHQIVILQEKEIRIRPLINRKTFFQHQHYDSETPPILS